MTDIPLKLVTPPTADQEIQQRIVSDLEHMLDLAKAGELHAMVIICERGDGLWMEKRSGTSRFCALIGRLEVIKAEYIREYLAEEEAHG